MERTMATEATEADYAAMVAQAEEAVAAVKDPELRRVAFEKILATLLGGGFAGSSPTQGRLKQPRAKPRPPTGTRRPAKRLQKGPKAYIEQLINDGFFKKQRTIADVKSELANRGHHIALTSLSGPLQTLTQERKLRRQKVAANSKGKKTTYAYSNW
jgi:hypothetical protein